MFACDLRGFGDSSRYEDELSWAVFRDDVMSAIKNGSGFVRQVLKEETNLPWFGFGHSIGEVLLNYAMRVNRILIVVFRWRCAS